MGGILHVHPTLHCNLACRHCYSSSGPSRREALPFATIDAALADARALGYDVLSLSGGEPLLYRPIAALVARARELGYRAQLVTNGFLVPQAVRDGWLNDVATVAVSIDGYLARHNAMRGHPRAWTAVLRAMEALAPRAASAGLNFTLSPDSIDDLPMVVGMALENGLGLLQLHALEAAGRADGMMHASTADDHLARCFAAAALTSAEVRGRLYVQCDLMPSCEIASQPAWCSTRVGDDGSLLSDRVPVLVIDADGDVRPLSYSMPAAWSLGNLRQCRLRDLAGAYLANRSGAARLAALWTRLAETVKQPTAPIVVNLYDELTRLAQAA